MKKIILLTCLLILTLLNIVSAQTYPLPDGYKAYTQERKEIRLEADFDKDGKQDLILLALKGNDNNQPERGVALLFLSTAYKKRKTYAAFHFDDVFQYAYDEIKFSFAEDTLQISCAGGMGKYVQTYNFKYITKLKNMQLISFYEWFIGDVSGAYFLDKKVDLLAQAYKIKGTKSLINEDQAPPSYEVKEKIVIQTLTFKDFDESGKNNKLLVSIGKE